jgi:very-short-patch-repair endonuclease
MGVITKEILVNLNSNRVKYFDNLGYLIPRTKNKQGRMTVLKGTKILIKVEDLPVNSTEKVDVECDGCRKILEDIVWQSYKKYVKEDGKYYCVTCANNLYSRKNATLTKLKKSKSFEQWCIENNRQDILNRWDYELNNCKPNEICFSTKKKYYFKCPRNIHHSELKNIANFTHNSEGSMYCNYCNSFAQWGIDNICEDFLDKYWDYDINTLNPWEISYGSNIKVWIKCQEILNHESYDIQCNDFINSCRCPECKKSKGEIKIREFLRTYNIYYISQKEFDDLIGLGGGNLSYDFYLPKYNLLIEYQGRQHKKYNPYFHKSIEDFEKQVEHDRRKKEYALSHGYNFLEIWYWDFDNIEEILISKIKELFEKDSSLLLKEDDIKVVVI